MAEHDEKQIDSDHWIWNYINIIFDIMLNIFTTIK